MDCAYALTLLRHFVNLLDSKNLMNPAVAMKKTNLRWSLTTILGQLGRNFPSCTESFSHLGLNVAFFSPKNDGLSVSRNPTENTGPSSAHLAWRERHRQPQARQCRVGARRNCEQQCMRGDISTGEATLPGRCAATREGQTWLSPLQVSPRKCVPRESACLVRPSPTDLRGEDDEPGCATLARQFCQSAPGQAVPSRVRADTGVVSMASCAPPCSGSPSATDPNHGPSRSFAHGRLPPGTHARLHSRVGTPFPRTPATAQAARWWPRLSRGRPHRQLEHQHAEGLGVKRRRLGGWERHVKGRRERARLGPQQRSLLHWEGGHRYILPEIQFQTPCCELLPTEKRLGLVLIFDGTSPRSQTFSQHPDRRSAASLIVMPSMW